MKFSPSNIYYVYNEGINRQALFRSNSNYQLFLNKTEKLLLPHSSILAYNLMPNYFEFLLQANDSCHHIIKQGGLFLDPLANGFRKLLSGYARFFNNQYGRTGNLFRQKTKSICLYNESIINPYSIHMSGLYCRNSFNDIHYTPVREGLVANENDWKWSSFRYYAGFEAQSICNRQLAHQFCKFQEKDFHNKVSWFYNHHLY